MSTRTILIVVLLLLLLPLFVLLLLRQGIGTVVCIRGRRVDS